MESCYAIATCSGGTCESIYTGLIISLTIPGVWVASYYCFGCSNDRLNIEGVGSSDHVITTSLYYQGHSVSSRTTSYSGIERCICPIYIIDISCCCIIFTIVVCLDCISCTNYIWHLTRSQYWCCSWYSSQDCIGHYLWSNNWSDNIGIDRIQSRRNYYGVVPCLGWRNQRRDDMLLSCDKIYILSTITNILWNSIALNHMNWCWYHCQFKNSYTITTIFSL